MQQVKELLEKHECATDDKARRRSNTAPGKVALITADELENGVTLETLQALNVPVYQYATQITIHGKLPEFSDKARPGGYKSIVRNQNGTIGVRYAAIDAGKKQLIQKAARLANVNEGGYSASIDSRGLELYAMFSERAAGIQAAKEFPRDLFAGAVAAYALPFGAGYMIQAEVGAIPTANVWKLCGQLFGVHSAAELARLAVADDARREKESAERNAEMEARYAEYAKEQEKLTAQTELKAAELVASLNLPKLTSPPLEKGARFVAISRGRGIAKPVLYIMAGKAFGKPLAISAPYTPETAHEEFTYCKKTALDPKNIKWLETRAARGELFRVN